LIITEQSLSCYHDFQILVKCTVQLCTVKLVILNYNVGD
jgi:hypothetical protein